ncbi:M23 family metallopeptidase, partial [Tetragenococcus koreensis]|nr:M23 family metallopeptidase [Tetragenococcus koreensis]
NQEANYKILLQVNSNTGWILCPVISRLISQIWCAKLDLINYDEAEKELGNESGDYITPVEKPTLTSQFGQRGSGFHRGIDFAAAKGTPIKAAKNGKVIQSEYHPSWGNYVAIKHSDGLTTLYAHCSRNIAKVGQTVKQGQTIALLGSTGNSTGPHLHFEVNRSQNLEQKQLINPLQVLKE